MRCLIAVFVLLVAIPAFACESDFDCNIGSRCAKPRGSLAGVCVGGMNPGNQNDGKPAQFFGDMNGTYGNTCSWDLECGVGYHCHKSGGSLYGVCGK